MHVEQGSTDAPRSFVLGGAPLQAAHGGMAYFTKVGPPSKTPSPPQLEAGACIWKSSSAQPKSPDWKRYTVSMTHPSKTGPAHRPVT